MPHLHDACPHNAVAEAGANRSTDDLQKSGFSAPASPQYPHPLAAPYLHGHVGECTARAIVDVDPVQSNNRHRALYADAFLESPRRSSAITATDSCPEVGVGEAAF